MKLNIELVYDCQVFIFIPPQLVAQEIKNKWPLTETKHRFSSFFTNIECDTFLPADISSNRSMSSDVDKKLETNHVDLARIQGRTVLIMKAILERVIYTCLNFGLLLFNAENIVKWLSTIYHPFMAAFIFRCDIGNLIQMVTVIYVSEAVLFSNRYCSTLSFLLNTGASKFLCNLLSKFLTMRNWFVAAEIIISLFPLIKL